MRRRFNICSAFLAEVVLCTFSVSGYATTYYVSRTGDDNNPGTILDKPFQTLQKAANIVQAGDVILVLQGTYPGFWIKGKYGRANAWIVFKSYPGHKVILDSYTNGYANTWRGIEFSGSSYIEINGFEITDSNPLYDSDNFDEYSQGNDHDGIKINPADGSYPESSYLRFINNHIYRTGCNGILAKGNHHEFINNYIHHIALSKRGYGMYISGSDHIIRGNIIHDSYGYGIHLYDDSPDRILVEGNILYNNGRDDYARGYGRVNCDINGCPTGDGILHFGGNNSIIRNNLCYNNRMWGIRTSATSDLVVNNTCYGNKEAGIYVYDNLGVILRNNISYQNGGENYIGSGNTQDHNLFSIDPKFIKAGNGDFHLQANSPAIDAGILIAGFTTDLEGTARPQHGGWDIGAYEFGGIPSFAAYLSANPTSGLAPLIVHFGGSASSGKAPYNYLWNFGDGNTSAQQNPTHTYTQANSYTATLTVTDNDNKHATASQSIVAEAISMNKPVVTAMRISEVNQAADLRVIRTEKWYDLYLYLDDPQGWSDISYVGIWLNHESDKHATVANHGGTFFAASNYTIAYHSFESGQIWAKETEGTATWTNITGQLGLYVDDDNNEYKQNRNEKWAKAKIRLLPNARTGNWTINAYVIDKAGQNSTLLQKNIRISNAIDQTPPSPPQNVRVGIGSP